MAGKVKVQLPDGKVAEGTEVSVEESSEKWSEYNLADGAKIRIKQLVVQVIRLDGQYDPEGNPMYTVKGSPVMVVSDVPEDLKQKKQ